MRDLDLISFTKFERVTRRSFIEPKPFQDFPSGYLNIFRARFGDERLSPRLSISFLLLNTHHLYWLCEDCTSV